MAVREIGLQIKVIGTDQQVKEIGKVNKGLIALAEQRKELIKLEKQANAQLKSSAETQKKINEDRKGTAANRRNAVKAQERLNEANRKATDTLRKNSGEIGRNRDKTLQLQNSKRRLEQTIKSKIRADQTNANTMERVRGVLSRLKNEIDKVDISTKQGRKDFARLANEIKASENKIRDFNERLGRGRTFVGEYSRGAVRAFKEVAAAAGVAFGVATVVRFGREAVRVGADFQQSIANLGAISRASAEDLIKLEELAKELGRTSIFTASQIAEMETALARLGFTPDQIIASTKAVAELAAATGEGLAESAEVAANTLRAFGLEAEETQRIVDVMALSFGSSALTLAKFSTAMSTVAPVAKTFGFEVEETTALLAKLVDAGFEASRAGTSLRNIFLKMADSGGSLAKALGGNVTNAEELFDGLIKLRESGIDLNETLQLTDRRSVAAFNRFLETAESTRELTAALKEAQGTAAEMAKIQLATLTGDLKLLASAVQGVVIDGFLKMEESLRAVVQSLVRFIIFLQENATAIKNITKGITLLTVAVLAYNIAAKASAAITAAWATIVSLANGSITAFTVGVKLGTAAMRVFSRVIRLNPLGLLAAAVIALTTSLLLFEKPLKRTIDLNADLVKATQDFNKEIIKEKANVEGLFKILKDTNATTEERRLVLDEINKLYGRYLPNLLTEKTSLEDISAAQKIVNVALISNLAIRKKQEVINKAAERNIKIQQEINQEIIRGVEASGGFSDAAIEGFNSIIEKQIELKETIPSFQEFENSEKAIVDFAERYGFEIDFIQEKIEQALRSNKSFNNSVKNATVEFKRFIKEIIIGDQDLEIDTETQLEKKLQDQINNQKAILALIEKGGQEEIAAKIKLIELERDLKLEAIGQTNAEELLITARAKSKIIALEKQSNILKLNEQKFALQAEIELLEEGSIGRSIKEIALLELEFEKKLLTIKRGGEQEKALRQQLALDINNELRTQRAVASAQEIKDIQNATKLVLIELDKRLIEEPRKTKEIEEARRKELLESLDKTKDILLSEINEIQNIITNATSGLNLSDKILSPAEKAALEQRLESLKLKFAELGLKYAEITQNRIGEEENLLVKLGLDDNGIAKFKAAQEIAVNIISSLSDIFTDLSNRRLDEIQRERNASLTRFDDEIKAAEAQGKSTRVLLIQRAAAEEKFNKQQREVEKEANKRAKALAISQAIISTANAVIAAFASGAKFSPIAGAIAAAAAAALGATQIGIIAKEPLKKGGIVKGGSHQEGGIGLYDHSSGRFLSQEIEGGEPVLTRGVAENPALLQIASDINQAAGGRKLAKRGTIISKQLQSGGVIAARTAPTQSSLEDVINRLDGISAQRVQNLKVTNVAVETTDTSIGVANIEQENTIIN